MPPPVRRKRSKRRSSTDGRRRRSKRSTQRSKRSSLRRHFRASATQPVAQSSSVSAAALPDSSQPVFWEDHWGYADDINTLERKLKFSKERVMSNVEKNAVWIITHYTVRLENQDTKGYWLLISKKERREPKDPDTSPQKWEFRIKENRDTLGRTEEEKRELKTLVNFLQGATDSTVSYKVILPTLADDA